MAYFCNMIAKTIGLLTSLKGDHMGMFTSILCALHCSAVPVFVSLGLVSGAGHAHNHYVDLFLATTGLVIALYTLVKDYMLHRSSFPIMLALGGFLILFTSILYFENTAMNIMGGLLVAAAHFLNLRVSKVCRV